MGKVEASIDVNVPVSTAYNQWTQFEEFPQFMEGVKQVRQLDDRTLEWTANIAGSEETWRAEIDQQEPDQRIAWHSIEGARNAGAVDFHRLDDNTTRIMLMMEFEPEGAVKQVGDALGFPERRVRGDLQRFKDFIESRGGESGAWRGRIEQTKV